MGRVMEHVCMCILDFVHGIEMFSSVVLCCVLVGIGEVGMVYHPIYLVERYTAIRIHSYLAALTFLIIVYYEAYRP